MLKAYIKAHNIISVLVSNAIDLFIIGGRTGRMYVVAYLGAEQAMLGSQTYKNKNVKFVVERINNITAQRWPKARFISFVCIKVTFQ